MVSNQAMIKRKGGIETGIAEIERLIREAVETRGSGASNPTLDDLMRLAVRNQKPAKKDPQPRASLTADLNVIPVVIDPRTKEKIEASPQAIGKAFALVSVLDKGKPDQLKWS